MARDSPEPASTAVRRKRTGATAGKEKTVRQTKERKEEMKEVTKDIQEALTHKLETLLERDRPEVRTSLRMILLFTDKKK